MQIEIQDQKLNRLRASTQLAILKLSAKQRLDYLSRNQIQGKMEKFLLFNQSAFQTDQIQRKQSLSVFQLKFHTIKQYSKQLFKDKYKEFVKLQEQEKVEGGDFESFVDAQIQKWLNQTQEWKDLHEDYTKLIGVNHSKSYEKFAALIAKSVKKIYYKSKKEETIENLKQAIYIFSIFRRPTKAFLKPEKKTKSNIHKMYKKLKKEMGGDQVAF